MNELFRTAGAKKTFGGKGLMAGLLGSGLFKRV